MTSPELEAIVVVTVTAALLIAAWLFERPKTPRRELMQDVKGKEQGYWDTEPDSKSGSQVPATGSRPSRSPAEPARHHS